MKPTRILAIDWSGAASAASQRRHIVVAEVDSANISAYPCACRTKNVGTSNIATHPCAYPIDNVDASHIQLHSGRTRQELIGWLCDGASSRLQSAVIGFDFSFSLPASFLRKHQCRSVFDLWKLVAREGEGWLRDSPPPFWGRPGKRRPELAPEDALRRSERAINIAGIQPKSTFQTGGAGAAGTGSLRGMPLLLRLHEAGFSIWPFDQPRLPIVVEIYPRLLTGPVVKSNPEARLSYLSAARFANLPEAVRNQAAASEDAFDALVSALAMAEHAAEFGQLRQATDPVERLEGCVWQPDQIPVEL